MSLTELKPCPHCGSSDIEIVQPMEDNSGETTIYCRNCWSYFFRVSLAKTPEGKKQDVIDMWNQRAKE